MFLIETFDPLMQGCLTYPTLTTFTMISRHYMDRYVIIFIYNNNIMYDLTKINIMHNIYIYIYLYIYRERESELIAGHVYRLVHVLCHSQQIQIYNTVY